MSAPGPAPGPGPRVVYDEDHAARLRAEAAAALPPFLTGRQARELLAGEGVPERSTRHLLDNGWAGTPIRTSSALLFETRAVLALALRPRLGPRDLDAFAIPLLLVTRRAFPAGPDAATERERLRGPWPLGRFASATLRAVLRLYGPQPLIATVAGIVVQGAEITGARPGRPEPVPGGVGDAAVEPLTLDLAPAGPWFPACAATRVTHGPGRPWVLHGFDQVSQAPRHPPSVGESSA
ncbi:hypothetical protein [Nocardioides sp. GY 10127]|uniref:hypothetical protein n=1 Tax=Nocardioides sp. GY 10127 TaxID=2569762 RepID=UPI0010A8B1CB|nr:hypothetical protein [Nocardioides sp. GY 10127]TIC80202.1 hypothetical protein E8D37_16605 [Nocardioides sp. GY 10127]